MKDMLAAFEALPDAFTQCEDPETAERAIEMVEKAIAIIKNPLSLASTVLKNLAAHGNEIFTLIESALSDHQAGNNYEAGKEFGEA